MRYRKKPVEVEAIQWTGKNTREVKAWISEQEARHPVNESFEIAKFIPRRGPAMTETLWQNVADEDWSDDVTAAVYDYLHETYVGVKNMQFIIFGTKGELYPCDPDGDVPLNYEKA